MPRLPAFHGLRAFGLIWLGQLVSVVGSGTMRFALSVWVYQQNESATQFAFVLVCATLPLVLLWPVAGAVADRWDRRTVLLLSDAGAGLTTLSVWLLLQLDLLAIWHTYAVVAASAAFGAFQWPAYSASIPLLVSRRHLGRANGLVELSDAVGRVLAPFLGGVLLVTIGLQGVAALDAVTFSVALVTLLLARIPAAEQAAETAQTPSLPREIADGWRFIRQRPGLVALLAYFVTTNFTSALPQVLFTPLVLSFASEVALGTALSFIGIGMLVGGLVMSAWGGPENRVRGVIGFVGLQGVAFVLSGLRPDLVLVTAAVGLYGFCLPILKGCHQTLWQRKVPPSLQGRVLALRRAITGLSYPLAYAMAGPLADYVFEPLLLPDGPLAGIVGPIIGIGAGRGIGLLTVLAGLLTIALSIAAYLHPRLRNVEEELPDALAADPATILRLATSTGRRLRSGMRR